MKTMTMIHHLTPPPPSHCHAFPSLATKREVRCGVCRHPSQVSHDGRSCGRVTPPAHQVNNASIIHMANAEKDII
jgi:hypothetical protein